MAMVVAAAAVVVDIRAEDCSADADGETATPFVARVVGTFDKTRCRCRDRREAVAAAGATAPEGDAHVIIIKAHGVAVAAAAAERGDT
mmetsp:Transcript_23588/g.57806  ORF Transcript_23588/g.57806 Transcript_23588/m.57806 type:complete len:88 (-) Transcript_23588:53-316(-)